jgi:23S rRNA (cytosine1962-C5)-methyltransferase
MIIANNWKEYEILDTGDGAKLEKWGTGPHSFILSRPDPQVIWPKEKPELWDKADGIYTRSATGGGSWNFPDPSKKPPEKWQIKYGELKLSVSPTDFKHMGLFPEQAANWDWVAEMIKTANKEVNILNLFAYTGGATVAAAKAGAKVTHVDASKGIVEWAKENLELNDLGDKARLIIDDVQKFVLREERRGVKYDAIIMDPPSYGRGKNGETWKIEKMLWPLIVSCKDILVNRPLFFLINSYTTGLGPTVIKNILESAMSDYGGSITSEELVLPIRGSNKVLPAGVSGRWSSSTNSRLDDRKLV